MTDTPIVILMGGQSRRMGTDKAFVPWIGKTMLEHQIDQLSPLSNNIFLSINETQLEKVNGNFNLIIDKYSKKGPLGGILSCLEELNRECVFVPVDMPNSKELVKELLNNSGNHCFKTGQQTEPLPIRISNKEISHMKSELGNGKLSVLSYIMSGYCNFLSSNNRNLFLNVNSLQDKNI